MHLEILLAQPTVDAVKSMFILLFSIKKKSLQVSYKKYQKLYLFVVELQISKVNTFYTNAQSAI
jgi:hypothetical protein